MAKSKAGDAHPFHSARIQPARYSRLQPPPRRGLTPWSIVAAVTASDSSLLARADQILNESVELLLRERLAEGLRHHVLRIARSDVGVRVDDRLAHEVRQRLPG